MTVFYISRLIILRLIFLKKEYLVIKIRSDIRPEWKSRCLYLVNNYAIYSIIEMITSKSTKKQQYWHKKPKRCQKAKKRLTKGKRSDIINKLSVEAQRNLERRCLGMNGSSQNVYLTKPVRCDKIERLSQRRERTENEFTICLLDKISDMWYNKGVAANSCNLKSILKIEQWAKKV